MSFLILMENLWLPQNSKSLAVIMSKIKRKKNIYHEFYKLLSHFYKKFLIISMDVAKNRIIINIMPSLRSKQISITRDSLCSYRFRYKNIKENKKISFYQNYFLLFAFFSFSFSENSYFFNIKKNLHRNDCNCSKKNNILLFLNWR